MIEQRDPLDIAPIAPEDTLGQKPVEQAPATTSTLVEAPVQEPISTAAPKITPTSQESNTNLTFEESNRQNVLGSDPTRLEDVSQIFRSSKDVPWVEKYGLVGAKREGALTEFGQAFAGSLVDVLRSNVSTWSEIGVLPKSMLKEIEDWQSVNQNLQVYEGAKPFSSWAGFMGTAGQGLGTMVPTIAIGATFGKIGMLASGSMRAAKILSQAGTALSIQSQFLGDDIKFFNEEVGLSKPQSMLFGMLTSTAKTALNMVFGVERKITDMTANGLVLNALKQAGTNAALRDSIASTSRAAIIAKITGNARPYFRTLKDLGLELGGESFTEIGELFVDDMVRSHFVDKPFSSFREYFDTGVATIPSTLMLGAFGSYRQHRNQMMIEDLLKPIKKEDMQAASRMYSQQALQDFTVGLNRLYQDILKVMQATTPGDPARQAQAATDVLAAFALKSAMKLDRHDGKRVSPADYIDGFRVAVARMQLDPAQLQTISKMGSQEAFDKLAEWGVIDEVDRVRKNSDAEDAAFVRRAIEEEMRIVLDPLLEAKDERAMSGWWSTRAAPTPVGAEVAAQAPEGAEAAPVQPSEIVIVPDQDVATRRIEANPTLATVDDTVIVPPANVVSDDMRRRATTNPMIFKSGDTYYALRRLEDGRYGLVPTQALTSEQEVARIEEQKKRIQERKAEDKKIKVVPTEGGVTTGEEQPATARDLTIYQGRVFAPEGNTVENATARNAAEIANLNRVNQESKAQDLVNDEAKPKTINDLALLPELLNLSDEEVRQQMAGERDETIQRLLDKLEGIRRVRNFERRASMEQPVKQRRPADRPAIREQLKSLSELPFIEDGGQMLLRGMDRPAMMMEVYHGTPYTFESEAGFPHGRFRLDQIVERGRGLSELGWGINFGPSWVAEGFAKQGMANVYTVDIPDADVANTMSWRNPVSDSIVQKIQQAIQTEEGKRIFRGISISGMTGEQIYDVVRRSFVELGNGPLIRQRTSEYLASIGIVGSNTEVRFGGNTGTHYVIWSQPVLDRVAMLEKNQQALTDLQEKTASEEDRGVRFMAEEVDTTQFTVPTATISPAQLKKGTKPHNLFDNEPTDDLIQKQINAIESSSDLPGYAGLPKTIFDQPSPKGSLDSIVSFFKNNLIALHNAMPQVLRERARLWYDGSRKIADANSAKYNKTVQQSAGVLAVLSPQKNWFHNVSQANQVMAIWETKDQMVDQSKWDESANDIISAAQATAKAKKGKTKEEQNALDQKVKDARRIIMDAIRGKSIADLYSQYEKSGSDKDLVLVGWAIRTRAQAEFGRLSNAFTPEGSDLGTYTNEEGKPLTNTWGSINEITKAISILVDGSTENIGKNLGDEHKVRNFYNNILNPNDPRGYVTIDTHAVAAAHILPFGASALPVKHNFGAGMPSSSAFGYNGTYHIYARAYRDAANELGLLPRELQSIVWEAVRGMYPAETKGEKYVKDRESVWQGNDESTARDILSRQTIQTPFWARTGVAEGLGGVEAGTGEIAGQETIAGRGVRDRGGPRERAGTVTRPAMMMAISSEQDAAYMAAIKSGDIEAAQQIVDEAANDYIGEATLLSPQIKKYKRSYENSSDAVAGVIRLAKDKNRASFLIDDIKKFARDAYAGMATPKGLVGAIDKLVEYLKSNGVVTLVETITVFGSGKKSGRGVRVVDESKAIDLANEWTAKKIQDVRNVSSILDDAKRPITIDEAITLLNKSFPNRWTTDLQGRSETSQRIRSAINTIGDDIAVLSTSGISTSIGEKTGVDQKGAAYIPVNRQTIARDSQGNIIPLSQRFQPTSPDIRFMAEPAQSLQVGKKQVKGLYLASQQIAVFFEGADAITVLHEYFHHVQAAGLVPTSLQQALNRSFGDIDDPAQREEREAEAFTRYLTNGTLPAGADPKLAQTFEYLKSTGNLFYGKITQRWQLPDATKQELDSLFTGANYDFQHDAVAEATLSSLESDKAVNMMAIQREPTKMGFHMAKNNFASNNGMSEAEVRDLLIQSGMKGYILAKDDKSGNQQSDMTYDELAEATEFLAQKNATLRQERKLTKQRETAVRKWGGQEEVANTQAILDHLATMPDKPTDRQDYEGGIGFVKKMKNHIKRSVKFGLSKVSTYWNVAKMLDGGQEDGPFQRLVATRLTDGENLKAEAMDRVEKVIQSTYERLGGKGAISQPADLTQLVSVGGIKLHAAKVASIYIISEGGNPDSKWGKALSERNEEVTSQVIRDAATYVNSAEGKLLKNYIEVVRSVMKSIQPELDQTAKDIGLEGVGNLGDWYLPFISEEGFKAQGEWDTLLNSISPISEMPGMRGVRRPSQIQSRADMANIGDEQTRLALLQSMGRLNLNIDEILSRYIESSANYIGKARNVKLMTKVLENPMIAQGVARKQNTEFLDALKQIVRREMYPGGRETRMVTGERTLQYIRNYSTLSMLGYRLTSGLRQIPSLNVGWATYVTRPQDMVRSLAYVYQAMVHGNGIDKVTKVFGREPLKGFAPYEEMITDHPSLKYRSFEPEHRDMARSGIGVADTTGPINVQSKGFFRKFVKHSMDHIRFLDTVMVASIYKSAKEHQLEVLQDAVARGDMTLEQANQKAANFALQAIDKTQNPSNMTQRTLTQTENEFMKALNPFSGQRFINLNYYLYDVMLPILRDAQSVRGVTAKTGAVAKGLWNHKKQLAFAWATPALMFGLIARRRLPEDEEEVFMDLMMYPFSSIPVVGTLLQSYVSGKFTDYAYDPTMIGAMARSVNKSFDATLRATGLRRGDVNWKDVNEVRRLVSIVTRTPEYPTQVLQNFIQEMNWQDKPEGNVMLRIFQMKVEPSKPAPVEE